MWLFNRKKAAPTPEPKIITISDPAQVRAIRVLHDVYQRAPYGEDTTAHFDLWTYIRGAFPETQEGSWWIDLTDALTVKIVEGNEPVENYGCW